MEQYLAGVKDRSVLESGSIDNFGMKSVKATLDDFERRGITKDIPKPIMAVIEAAFAKYYPKIDSVANIIVNKDPKSSNVAYWLLSWVPPHWKVVEIIIDSRSNKVVDHRIVDL